MRKTLAAIVLSLLALSARAQGVQSSLISTGRISPSSPARYVYLATASVTATATGTVVKLVYPYSAPGRLVDVIHYQNGAGTGGTSYTLDVKVGATSLLSTLGVVTLASGADKITDAKAEVALPAGWTRPVIKSTSEAVVMKGAVILINTTETGTYSPHPTFMVELVFEPLQ